MIGLLLAAAATAGTRPVGVPTPVEAPEALATWFRALDGVAGGGTARALQYGDSTIIADGFTRAVRARLAARFGDGGPGFVTAAFDPAVHSRVDVAARRGGSWALKTLLFGGADGNYGLGGIVGVMRPGASVRVGALDGAGAARSMRHAEVWYQAGAEGYGTLEATVGELPPVAVAASAAATEDRAWRLDVPGGFAELRLAARDGAVPVYGVVLEDGPGTTWEQLGVLGVGSKSYTTFGGGPSLPTQMGWRDPDLVAVMLGGNEAGFPVLLGRGGAGYDPIYGAALDVILAGKGDASCLVLTPLDQGMLDEETGEPRSRPGMANMVAAQRRVALAHGCAFWSTWDAMGGAGSAVRWGSSAGLGTGDYVHVTARGLDLLGNLLADALLGAYDTWRGAAPSP